MSAFNQDKGLKRLLKTATYSRDGLQAALAEPAVRQLLLLHAGLMLALVWLPATVPVKMVLVLASFLSVIVEFFNTALEAAVDHTSMEIHPLAKIAKDVGSAAQALCLILLAVLWAMALLP